MARAEGTDAEARFEVEAHIQRRGSFQSKRQSMKATSSSSPIRLAGPPARLLPPSKFYDVGAACVQHTEVEWGDACSWVV